LEKERLHRQFPVCVSDQFILLVNKKNKKNLNLLFKVHDNGFTLSKGGRVYFSTGGDIGDPNIYWQTPLLGNQFSYEIDVSNVGCSCNAAVYFSQLPGYNAEQTPEAGEGLFFLVSI
jgi:hypothetical protein